MIFVEGLFIGMHGGVVIPGFGNQHGHDMRQGTAGQHKQFDGVVQGSGIAAIGLDDGVEFLNVIAPKWRSEYGLTSSHPVAVAFDGIDFAVVAQVAERMSQLPSGKRVGGKALVHHADGTDGVWVSKVLIELVDLRS